MTISIRSGRLLVAASLFALVAACSPGTGDLGPLPSASGQVLPSLDVPSTEPTPGDVTPSDTAPSPSPSAVAPSPTPATTPRPTATPVGTTIVRAYFFLGSFTDNAGLVPVLREIPKTPAVGAAAMRELLAGPNAKELGARPAMYTTVPTGTELLGLSISNGVATVNLSREFESGGGSASMLGRLAQVVYTLTQFSSVDKVTFQLDGQPVTVFGGEGVVLDAPVGRSDYHDQLPAIFVDRPAWGAALGNPGRVSGVANVFEAAFRVQIVSADGGILVDKQVTASCGTGCWGTFSTSLDYTVGKAQWGTLRVFEPSAKDGSPINVTRYPVWLTPG